MDLKDVVDITSDEVVKTDEELDFIGFENSREFEVIDDLNSKSSFYPLSANQGRMLNERINNFDSNINDFENKMETAINNILNKFNNLLDTFYPVGSIFQCTKDIDPNTAIGGSWQKIENRFLLGSGELYSLGSQGGAKDAFVVSHTHSMVQAGGHTHDIPRTILRFDEKGTFASKGTYYQYKGNNDIATSSAGAHSHNINSTGQSGVDANMPPYVVVNIWQRTA